MPKSWYIMSENKVNEEDSEEEILRKQLYQRICADKKPYFFCHNYLSLKKEYNDYINRINEKSIPMFGMPYAELRKKEEKTEKEASFIEYADRNIPLDMSPSVMNKICWSIEDQLDNIQMPLTDTFDSSMIKSGYKYSICAYKEIEKLYKTYKKKIGALAKKYKSEFYEEPEESFDSKEQIHEWFAEKCMEVCSNQYELCDILIDICYRGRNDKEPVWVLCGNTIIENLLKNNNDNMYYPAKVNDNEEFECCGSKFVMKKIKNGGDN